MFFERRLGATVGSGDNASAPRLIDDALSSQEGDVQISLKLT